ncbi:hypothetical protein [Aetokthonos hydrillicola]|nr:hypothetical protein [Aetokthonos hydrillicola]
MEGIEICLVGGAIARYPCLTLYSISCFRQRVTAIPPEALSFRL